MHTVVVHSFNMGDVEDPDLYAAEPLYDWRITEKGQWVMKNSIDLPIWRRSINDYHGYTYTIEASFTPEKYTFYTLKWDN